MKNPPPLALMLTAAGLQRLLAEGTPTTRTSRLLATVLGAGASAALAAPVLEFRRHQTTVDPRDQADPTSLVTTGINAHTRNPMYLGMAGLLLANAVRRPTLRALLPLVAFITWINYRQIPVEESALQQRFGDDYRQYRTKVPRWIDISHRCDNAD